MARLFAQFGAVVFLVVGVGGFLTGDAGTLVHNLPQGNLGHVVLHLTYTRDVLNLVIAGVLGYAGFRAGDVIAQRIVLAVGAVLLLLALVGFANPDTVQGTNSIAGLHFTQPVNIFDLIAGMLGVLCGIGGATARELVTT